MQSVPITTDVVSSNIDQGEVYNIMRQISGFLQVLRFPPLNKTDRNDISEILLKVALKQTKKNPVTQVMKPFLKELFPFLT